ncbi:MAG TPA: metal-dependent transcriptional regulator [Candidatus Eremiobacteraceae bacterium]|nr:metal-dependent transcriptional regulator [Candidatus Eremiobacteraceae bacterium]
MNHSALKAAPAAPVDEHEVSPNVEMYLKSIVRLFDGSEPVPTSAIAHELAVSAASASSMLKRLDAEGYVLHEGRHGVFPTPAGAKIGALTLRRQRLAERLLVDHLGISWEDASAEGCRLEHAISPLVERHLARFLGDPTTCPHGHPIPRDDGSLWNHEGAVDLADAPIGVPTIVLEVKNEIPELLKFLAEIGLRPGVAVTVHSRERAVGLQTIDVAGKEHTVSVQLAAAVVVRDTERAPSKKEKRAQS